MTAPISAQCVQQISVMTLIRMELCYKAAVQPRFATETIYCDVAMVHQVEIWLFSTIAGVVYSHQHERIDAKGYA